MSCSCSGTNNQTSAKAFKFLAEKAIDFHTEKGAGVFAVADPGTGPMQFKKIFVHDLSYSEVKLRGINCIAFKWIPYSLKGRSDIDAANPLNCFIGPCSDDAVCDTAGYECLCVYGDCG